MLCLIVELSRRRQVHSKRKFSNVIINWRSCQVCHSNRIDRVKWAIEENRSLEKRKWKQKWKGEKWEENHEIGKKEKKKRREEKRREVFWNSPQSQWELEYICTKQAQGWGIWVAGWYWMWMFLDFLESGGICIFAWSQTFARNFVVLFLFSFIIWTERMDLIWVLELSRAILPSFFLLPSSFFSNFWNTFCDFGEIFGWNLDRLLVFDSTLCIQAFLLKIQENFFEGCHGNKKLLNSQSLFCGINFRKTIREIYLLLLLFYWIFFKVLLLVLLLVLVLILALTRKI